MELSIQLAEVFLENPGGVFSIHQISKKLDIPYGTAYNRIHQLGKIGIVKIIPQGKAKLCSLNPANPMTVSLLCLGAAKTSAAFFSETFKFAPLLRKIRDFMESRFCDTLHTAILLNAENLANFKENFKGNDTYKFEATIDYKNEIINGTENEQVQVVVPLDFFLVASDEGIELENFETHILSVLSSQFPLRITKMVVTPSTLLGMLQERENEAGLSAFHMLRKGIILFGFEKFFHLVLKTFGIVQL